MNLSPAAWTGDGGGIYSRGGDVDYRVTPFPGGGVDIAVIRKTIFTSSTIEFGIKLPAGTHVRQGENVVLVETDAVPGSPAATIGTLSVPAARDAKGAPLTVTPVVGPGFPAGRSELVVNLGPANVFAFPVTISLAYRASDVPATGAPTPNWDGVPAAPAVPGAVQPVASAEGGVEGASVPAPLPDGYVTDPDGALRPDGVDPVLYAQRHSGHCQGGPDSYSSGDGRTADFLSSCLTQQICLASTPADTSVESCNNRLLAHMSIQCTTVFGQTGPDYDGCTRTAADQVAWVKANMIGGPE